MQEGGVCKCCGNAGVYTWCCETCKSSWCGSCNTNMRATRFIYGKDHICSFCCPKDMVFKCVACGNGQCASSECHKVGRYSQIFSRWHFGKCCTAFGDVLCRGCQTWEARRICIVMIGARKFRKSTLLISLPRDVLIYALVKPFVWETRGERDPCRKAEKKLKI